MVGYNTPLSPPTTQTRRPPAPLPSLAPFNSIHLHGNDHHCPSSLSPLHLPRRRRRHRHRSRRSHSSLLVSPSLSSLPLSLYIYLHSIQCVFFWFKNCAYCIVNTSLFQILILVVDCLGPIWFSFYEGVPCCINFAIILEGLNIETHSIHWSRKD